MGSKDLATDELASALVDQIGPILRQDRYVEYNSGSEEDFLDDLVNDIDATPIGPVQTAAGLQSAYIKCKQLHQSPYVVYPDILTKHNKQFVELGDILVVFNYWENMVVVDRQAFISQTKCHKERKPGRLYWEIHEHQFELLSDRPRFRLDYINAHKYHNLSKVTESFLNYSFVSDAHRPFFYRTIDMEPFIDYTTKTSRFYYGQNHPHYSRYLLSKLKNTLQQRYGATFGAGDSVFRLIEDIYQHGKLRKSRSSNRLPYTDGGHSDSGFLIVNVDVDTDDSVGRINDTFPDIGSFEEISEGLKDDIRGTIGGRFEEIVDEGLGFGNIRLE